ncbi:D-alanyl-D-alanine carboxypeptidase (penicillin-binding protein 5/6) [Agromyces cerinus]|uniref:serine hydrolase n=1 Tax=Agromyces cerinus TaxID=33878 RepID=UPI00195BE7F7|nr:serine hydrolase [Agromyces cerinus]MBM7830302.1 D-alanyl-D-alanine carboxypeptidase (penicillin-binding protein 5/6) [Agromyces cerinus]
MRMTPGRIVGIAVGAIAILGIGVYGPAMLLGPLPAVNVTVAEGADTAPEEGAAPVTLPADGASAMAVLADDGAATTLGVGGDTEPVPIGGAVKLVTVLATLDTLPLPPEGGGPEITIGPADYTDYLRYVAEDTRTLPVLPGEKWTERDVVRAVLLASSNNHADTLVRWAFGGVDPYVEAANAWLAENGFTATRVADATGLSGDNVGTPEELTRLAALVLADPRLAEIYAIPEAPVAAGERDIPDNVARSGEAGVRALARSYTDQAGVTFVYTTTVPGPDDETPYRLVGATTLMPDYETLDAAVSTAVSSSAQSAVPAEIITAGTPYASVEAAWGDRAELIASVSRTDASWGNSVAGASVTVEPFTTASAGSEVGRISIATGNGDVASPLELTRAIRDPGPIWRLANPAAIIGAFIADQQG